MSTTSSDSPTQVPADIVNLTKELEVVRMQANGARKTYGGAQTSPHPSDVSAPGK